MTYSIKELFYTLQGEGAHAGRPAVFCRFTGCNLWSGREEDRAAAICTFCDTDFIGTDGLGGGKFQSASDLAEAIESTWPAGAAVHRKYVVFTGGEPLLQLDAELIEALHQMSFTVAVETNGTLDAPAGLDWICVSPKQGSTLRIAKGNELKLVFPQDGAPPDNFTTLDFDHFYLQPMDGLHTQRNTQLALEYCKLHPTWSLSLQTHKILDIP